MSFAAIITNHSPGPSTAHRWVYCWQEANGPRSGINNAHDLANSPRPIARGTLVQMTEEDGEGGRYAFTVEA